MSACSRKGEVKARVADLERAFPAANANPYVNLALSAVRTNDYAGGVIALQSARRMTGVTPEQLMAVQKAMQAITAELVARAASGDQTAKADLAAIESTRSQ
ncbi:MAG: hypothetical protein ACYDH9_25060 [Limisphaerales bacterium]